MTTEPNWPTSADALQTYGPPFTTDLLGHAIGLCQQAFTEWRDNLLVELQRPATTPAEPEGAEHSLAARVAKLERKMKKLRKRALTAQLMAADTRDVIDKMWAPEPWGGPLDAISQERMDRLADEVRKVGCVTVEHPEWPVVDDDDPDADELPDIAPSPRPLGYLILDGGAWADDRPQVRGDGRASQYETVRLYESPPEFTPREPYYTERVVAVCEVGAVPVAPEWPERFLGVQLDLNVHPEGPGLIKIDVSAVDRGTGKVLTTANYSFRPKWPAQDEYGPDEIVVDGKAVQPTDRYVAQAMDSNPHGPWEVRDKQRTSDRRVFMSKEKAEELAAKLNLGEARRLSQAVVDDFTD